MEKALSILSGGLDSAVSTAIAGEYHNVMRAEFFDYGQRASENEKTSAGYLCEKWNIEFSTTKLTFKGDVSALTSRSKELPKITLADLEEDSEAMKAGAKAVWIPNRNGLFINTAAVFAEVGEYKWIITGFNREESLTFPDNSREFLESINKTLEYSTHIHPKVRSYVLEMDKTEILQKAIDLDIDISRLWVCYDAGEKWCGRCESCARTMRAMRNLGLFEMYRGCFQSPVHPEPVEG